jgi:2-oxoglutarate ferredoxin oxidoreductase subunit beta
MKIIICVGDGDTSAIGGNHFIHACRRNIDLTVICVNNLIYGMTGGQVAPSTPYGSKTTTTPFGSMKDHLI